MEIYIRIIRGSRKVKVDPNWLVAISNLLVAISNFLFVFLR